MIQKQNLSREQRLGREERSLGGKAAGGMLLTVLEPAP